MSPIPDRVMINIYIVNELNLPRILMAALLGKRPQILATAAIFPRLQPYLLRITKKLAQSFKAEMLDGSYPNLQHLKEYPAGIMMHNVFERTEERLAEDFKFESLDHHIADYAMACKHSICTYSAEKHIQILHINEYEESSDAAPATKIIGLTSVTQNLFGAYFGHKLPARAAKKNTLNFCLNLFICGLIISAGFVFGLSRWRPFGFKRGKFFLVADFINDRSDLDFFKALSDKGPICLVVRRGLKVPHDMAIEFQDWRVCKPEDGKFDTGSLLSFIKHLVKDSFRVLLYFKRVEPGLYYRLAMLPYQRLVMRALFDFLRPKNFWARDLYSAEHIIRTQELHRVGAKSHSIMHGFGGMTNIVAQFRYISFDRFYVFGRFLVDKYYGDTWDPNMIVTPVGSFREEGKGSSGLKNKRVDLRDILILTSFLARLNNSDARNIVRGLAGAFPERIIRLQVKQNFMKNPMTVEFIEACSHGLDNVVTIDGAFYDYIGMSGYAFSDSSTAIMECIQNGLPTFMIDVLNFHQACYYRDYPELIVTTVEQAIEKINSLEKGSMTFNLGNYEQLICMSVPSPQQIICEGMAE